MHCSDYYGCHRIIINFMWQFVWKFLCYGCKCVCRPPFLTCKPMNRPRPKCHFSRRNVEYFHDHPTSTPRFYFFFKHIMIWSFENALARYTRAKESYEESKTIPKYKELLRSERELSYYFCRR